MPGKTVREFQADVDTWIQQVGGGYWSPHANLARIAEEVGELARLLNHQYGPKPKKPDEQAQELGEELADIVFAVICLANSEGIDLQASLQQVIDKVWVRDHDRYTNAR
ncbi:MAG: nucleotide pyrophosphohydrolase [Anaerolineae bacterium]|jgi:NTP pyrophosphatase (non-canonical NTP hydrolase)